MGAAVNTALNLWMPLQALLERARRRREGSIERDVKEIGFEVMD
jgi:hypothetical protein